MASRRGLKNFNSIPMKVGEVGHGRSHQLNEKKAFGRKEHKMRHQSTQI